MKFAAVPLDKAEGAILAHSLRTGTGPIRKGTVLTADHLAALRTAGLNEVTVARLGANDVSENHAAQQIGARLASPGLSLTKPFTGRVNLVAERAGVVTIDRRVIDAVNSIDESLTLATLPDLMRVEEGQLVATIKVIPYGVEAAHLAAVLEVLGAPPILLRAFRAARVQLVLTRTPGYKESLLKKGREITENRIATLGSRLGNIETVAHEPQAVAGALDPAHDLILILGASATSDRADVIPTGLELAGGRIDRFGMPVDPGNLLLLGSLRETPVVGLPGCARSPALNGVDWVLERLLAGIPVDSAAIAGMGVGGLLKEMPGRPQPRHPRRS